MNLHVAKFVPWTWILVLSLLVSVPLPAQVGGATLSGTITNPGGAVVKSFDSGDSNRDLHMLQVTRGGQFPMVTVRTQLPENASTSATIHADLEVQFAGQTAKYDQVPCRDAIAGAPTIHRCGYDVFCRARETAGIWE
jgi:hypothetical protein